MKAETGHRIASNWPESAGRAMSIAASESRHAPTAFRRKTRSIRSDFSLLGLKVVVPRLDPGIHGATTGAAERDEGVDGRVKPGHDDEGLLLPTDARRQYLPLTALRFRGNDGSV